MRISRLVALAMVVGMNSQAARAERTAEQQVTVYLVNDANVPSPVLSQARTLATETFAGLGAQIEWRAGQRPKSQLLRERGDCYPLDPRHSGRIQNQRRGLHHSRRRSPYHGVVPALGMVAGEARIGPGTLGSRASPRDHTRPRRHRQAFRNWHHEG